MALNPKSNVKLQKAQQKEKAAEQTQFETIPEKAAKNRSDLVNAATDEKPEPQTAKPANNAGRIGSLTKQHKIKMQQ